MTEFLHKLGDPHKTQIIYQSWFLKHARQTCVLSQLAHVNQASHAC